MTEGADPPSHHLAFHDLVPASTGGGASQVGDVPPEELLRAWWACTEALVAVSHRLAAGLDAGGHISLTELDVLARLHRAPGHRLTMARIAADIGLTAGGFTRLADRLEQSDAVVREHSREDRRVVHLVLTDHGREIATAALERHVADLRRNLLEPLGPQGLRTLGTLARTLRDHQR